MFGCAIWDERSQSLLLGRDRLGIKPLLWAEASGGLLFASELKALLATGLVQRNVQPSAIYRFLHNLYVPAPETAIAGVHALEPGHQLKWQNGKVSLKRYWSVSYRPAKRRSTALWVEQFRSELAAAVKSHLMSDVPVGAFLSGGLDSSAVAALAVEASGDPGSLLTTTVGFAERHYDESDDAAIVARYLGTQHNVVRITSAEIEQSLEKVLACYDQPFADSSAVPTYLLCQAASRSAKVALAGDGADELMAGYPRHQQYLVLDTLRKAPAPARATLAGAARRVATILARKKSISQPLRQLSTYLGEVDGSSDAMTAYVHLRNVFRGDFLSALLAPDFAAAMFGVDPVAHVHAAALASDARTRLDRLLNVELLTYLPNDILTKVDIASMAFGLEVRVPFLDHRVVELVASMPTALKRNLHTSKVMLRRAIAPNLPRHTLRKRKQGFHMPVGPWFRNQGRALLEDTLLSRRCLERGYFSARTVEQLVRAHVTGRADHASRLWALLQLEVWHRNFVDVVR
jgi:asparagine synthase (glutamine-hydrolysing)